MRKRSSLPPQPLDEEPHRPGDTPPIDDQALFQNLIGLGDFSARKSYYPELLGKINELEQEKERYVWLFENALHGIFQAKIDGPVTAANPAIARICGYESAAQFQQIRHIGEQLFYPEDYSRLLKLLQRDGQKVGFETRLRTRSGKPVSISTNVLLKDREQGLIEAFVQDITERKRSEAELTRLNTELEQRVIERTKELIDAKQEAEAANASQDKYLAAASHDLLQPLNAARLLISALQGKSLDADNRLLVERTHEALEGAEALLTDLLDIAKLDANAVSADLGIFCAADLLAALASESEPLAAEAGLEFAWVNSRVSIHTDSRLLMRILRNFISNAIRYTEQGRILLGCRRRGAELEFQVWDTGPGIAADQRRAIFREFHQLEIPPQHVRQSASRDQGVGLGLAIVERIARVLGFQIELHSQLGQGSCFSLRVPIASITEQQAALPSLSHPASHAAAVQSGADLSGFHILVIENEASIRLGMRLLLEQWGCKVDCVEGLEEAQLSSPDQPPDLILADYHLHRGATGIEVIETLYQHYQRLQHPLPPAIIITADRSTELRKLFRDRGFQHLNKPLKPGKLRALMSHLLNPPL